MFGHLQFKPDMLHCLDTRHGNLKLFLPTTSVMLPGMCSEKHFKGAAYFMIYLEFLEKCPLNTVFRPYQ